MSTGIFALVKTYYSSISSIHPAIELRPLFDPNAAIFAQSDGGKIY